MVRSQPNSTPPTLQQRRGTRRRDPAKRLVDERRAREAIESKPIGHELRARIRARVDARRARITDDRNGTRQGIAQDTHPQFRQPQPTPANPKSSAEIPMLPAANATEKEFVTVNSVSATWNRPHNPDPRRAARSPPTPPKNNKDRTIRRPCHLLALPRKINPMGATGLEPVTSAM